MDRPQGVAEIRAVIVLGESGKVTRTRQLQEAQREGENRGRGDADRRARRMVCHGTAAIRSISSALSARTGPSGPWNTPVTRASASVVVGADWLVSKVTVILLIVGHRPALQTCPHGDLLCLPQKTPGGCELIATLVRLSGGMPVHGQGGIW